MLLRRNDKKRGALKKTEKIHFNVGRKNTLIKIKILLFSANNYLAGNVKCDEKIALELPLNNVSFLQNKFPLGNFLR